MINVLVGANDSTPFVKSVVPAAVLFPGSHVNSALLPSVNMSPALVSEIFPPFIVTVPFTVRFPVTERTFAVTHVNCPPAFTITLWIVCVALTVMICPAEIMMLSAGAGEPEGDQVEELFRSPDATEILLMADA